MPSLRSIQRDLRRRLCAIGRDDLARDALDRVVFTDDGSTIYVHIMRKPSWRGYRSGDAYPLAFADHPDLQTCSQWREFLREARALLDDDFPRIVAWLEGG
jgi:hypothetical protein